jgi:hypothetical protein
MVSFKNIIIGAVALLIGIGVTFYLFPSEEKKVKKQFRLLAEWVSKEPGENAITMAFKVKNVSTLFDRTCEFKIPSHSFSGSYTPEEISGYAANGRLYCSELRLKFYDLIVDFPEEGMAKVTLTAKLTGKSNAGEHIDETHELEAILRKTERKWLFNKFEVIEVLKK